ncbi:DUF6463 family protein [Paenibacillus sp. YPG26]|nr:DUF6463 family protein [Paenibacillus sp. YPG26]
MVAAAWILLALGVGHTLYGLVWFRVPFLEVFREGFVNKFKSNESRRSAFWFTIFGPLLMMSGHISFYLTSTANRELFLIIGFYMLIISLIGILALPKSPFWLALIGSLVFVAAGYGWIN